MSEDLVNVISRYKGSHDILGVIHGDYIVYDKSSEEPIKGAIRIPNYGYNLYSYLLYIIENYENLPKNVFLLKNNIFPRHMSRKEFQNLYSKKKKFFFSEKHIKTDGFFSFIDCDGNFNEINNSWFSVCKRHKYFGNFDSFDKYFIVDYKKVDYVKFSPGGNYFLKKDEILSNSIDFYKKILDVISYKENAIESYYVERAFGMFMDKKIQTRVDFNEEPTKLTFFKMFVLCLRHAFKKLSYSLSKVC